MSKILDMAKNFEQKSKEQANATETAVKNAFEQHETRIKALLSASEKTISSDLNAQNARIRNLALQTWIYIAAGVITLIIAFWGILWYQSSKITDNIETISTQNARIEVLKKQGGNITTSHCTDDKNRSRFCIKINKAEGDFVNGYMIPMGE